MAQDHQKEMFSYLNGTYGMNDYSSFGQLGYSKYEADQRAATDRYESLTTVSAPKSVSSTDSSWFSSDSSSIFSSTPQVGGTPSFTGTGCGTASSNSDAFEEFMSLSDWLFKPIEEKVSSEVAGGGVVFFAVVGAFLFPATTAEFSWITVGLGAVLGGIAVPLTYFCIRAAVSLMVLALIIVFWIGVAVIGFAILNACLN